MPVDDDLDQQQGVPQGTERLLTLAGLLAFMILVGLSLMHDRVGRLFLIHPALSICLVAAGIGMLFLAFYGLGNAWRLLRRGGRSRNVDNIDLGWGGAMGHYTEADEDEFGMPSGGGG